MNRHFRLLACVLMAGAVCAQMRMPTTITDAHEDIPGMGNRAERLEWLQDAGFGMFINWGLDSQVGSVMSHHMVGASKPWLDWYIKELPRTFHPRRWDPEEYVVLAKLAGMRYVVFDAKHHSGFCLWDTETTDFKITNTPYGKDVLYDYFRAVRKHGLAGGIYYSPEDFAWLYRNGYPVRRRNLDPHPDTDPAYSKFITDQVTELFTNYGPVDMLFIDGEGRIPTKKTAWGLQPNCLITRGAIATPEQYVPGQQLPGAWESNLTMGTQWNYKPTNEVYKSGTRIIEILIETRAKGGALLLNVGPKPNGEMPEGQEERLREVALWHAANGESIHDTRPWVAPREEDIWFTKQKDADTVYAFLTRIPDWPRGERRDFLLRSVKATSGTKISVLGHAGEIVEYMPHVDGTPRFEQTADGLRISVVRAQRLYNNHSWHNPVVVKLTQVQPAFEKPPYAETVDVSARGSGSTVFEGNLLELAGAPEVAVGVEYQEYISFDQATANLEWTASPMQQKTAPGSYRVEVSGLEPGKQYQFRAVVKHPKITMRGELKRLMVE
ncbi:MAG: alpha-L-fucosidase [bacterium]|nr:alpha-L-fucosidase [bacterium]